MGSQRLVHAADQGHDRFPGQLTHPHHVLRQGKAVLQGMHDRAGTGFNVQYDGIGARCQLFAENGGNDQGQGVHGGGHVPQAVKCLVRRREMAGLAHHGHSDLLYLADKILHRQANTQAGNGFQFIQGTAGMAQAPAAHLGHRGAAGGHQGRQHQRGRISHTAGGMLIHLDAGNAGKIGNIPGVPHCQGQIRRFPVCHAVQADRHQQGGKLVLRHRMIRGRLRKEGDLLFCQLPAEFFLFDDFHHCHAKISLRSL